MCENTQSTAISYLHKRRTPVLSNAASHFLAIAQCNIPLATCLAIKHLEQPIKIQKINPASTEIARQVARNVAPCNISDHETPIFKLNSLRDKLSNVAASLF